MKFASINLEQVVPWGRSLDEYVRMFDLTEDDLSSSILDCGGGPASFNADMHAHGRHAVSCDPIYEFPGDEISRRIDASFKAVLEKTVQAPENFVWGDIKSPEHLGQIRLQAMRRFLSDLPIGLAEGRYRTAQLPQLPFREGEFDLALCSHFLFTYSHLLSFEFHCASVRELCRIARECRIFPLLPNFGNSQSPHVVPVVSRLSAEGYFCQIRRVPYEFQKGGNEMLLVRPLC